jgi:hypothetical protein
MFLRSSKKGICKVSKIEDIIALIFVAIFFLWMLNLMMMLEFMWSRNENWDTNFFYDWMRNFFLNYFFNWIRNFDFLYLNDGIRSVKDGLDKIRINEFFESYFGISTIFSTG